MSDAPDPTATAEPGPPAPSNSASETTRAGGPSRLWFEPTELGVTLAFYARRRRDLHFVAEEGRWLTWDGSGFVRDWIGVARRRFQHALGTLIRDNIASIRSDPTLGENRKADLVDRATKWLEWVESDRGVAAGLRQLASLPGVTVHEGELDSNPSKSNFPNGTLDLVTGSLGPHVREDLITRKLPFDFDPKARAPTFLRALAEWLPDPSIREYAQRVFGRALVRNTERRRLILLYGPGANGKSVLLSAIGGVLDPFVVTADVATFLERRGGDAIPNDLARMTTARLVVLRELPEGRRFDESTVKAVTGGDKITARFLRQEYFDFTPGFVLVGATNSHPLVNDSPAMMDRLTVIPFVNRIPPDRQDPALLTRILREPAGIFNWCLEGLRSWRVLGLAPPPSVASFTAAISEESVPFSQFIDDALTREPALGDGRFAPSSWIFAAYNEWSRRLGQRPYDARWLGRRLGEAGFLPERFGRSRTRGYAGVAIRSEFVPFVIRHLEHEGTTGAFDPADVGLGSVPISGPARQGGDSDATTF